MPRGKTLTRKERKSVGFKVENLEAKSIRLPHETWEKLGWVAGERGLQIADCVRVLLGDAVKNAKPPKSLKNKAVTAGEGEWRKWQRAADALGVGIDRLICDAMAKVTAVVLKNLPEEPELEDDVPDFS